MARYLVVANQTLAAEELSAKVRECLASGPCTFHIVVPATHAKDHVTWTEGAAHAIAERRLDAALERFRALGAEVEGEVGDPSPMLCIRDAIHEQAFDAVILSTLPPGPSRWLKQDLPHRIERNLGMQVIHVTGSLETAGR
jgi:nucleotide-binding universal stress UspA family protein